MAEIQNAMCFFWGPFEFRIYLGFQYWDLEFKFSLRSLRALR
jgi:hypothetical protein